MQPMPPDRHDSRGAPGFRTIDFFSAKFVAALALSAQTARAV
jgi:hypothetical protein